MLVFDGLDPKNEHAPLHICPIWLSNGGTHVWGANVVSGEQFGLLMASGNGSWWHTHTIPGDEKFVGFWQVMRTNEKEKKE